MAKNLSDLRVFDYEFIDKAATAKDDGVLATLKGYATFSGTKDNKNKHFYFGRSKPGVTDSFWDKVLTDNAFLQERLNTKTFYGCSKHPEKGDSPVPEFGDLKNPISHVIPKYEIDDKGVKIQLDLMDTHGGREIYPFVKYGSKIGVSTRAYGEVDVDEEGYKKPVLDNYHFITWDIVTFPAFSNSRMDAIKDNWDIELDSDDINKSFDKKGFINELKNMKQGDVKILCDYSGLDIKEVLGDDYTENEDADALNQAMDKIVILEKKIEELSGSQNNDSELSKIKKELSDSKKQIENLTNERDALKIELQDNINSETKRLSNSNNILRDKIDDLKREKEELQDTIGSLRDIISDSKSIIAALKGENEELQDSISVKDSEYSKLQGINEHLEDKVKNQNTTSSEIINDSTKHNIPTVSIIKSKPQFRAFDAKEDSNKENRKAYDDIDSPDFGLDGMREVLDKVNN